MAELFQKAKSTINEHIKNIYADGELSEATTLRKFGNPEFSTKPLNFYNLDMVISVGYRVRSQRGVQFRLWAADIIKEYMVSVSNPLIERVSPGKVHLAHFHEQVIYVKETTAFTLDAFNSCIG